MLTLIDSTAGTYRIETLSSVYILDLDAGVMRRAPNAGDAAAAVLRQDEGWVRLVQILDCTVGARMELLIDRRVAGVALTSRRSTTVIEISPILDFDEARPAPQG